MELIHTIYEPSGPGPHPTILALHGWGASALDLIGLAPFISAGRFLVICPQGRVETAIAPGAVGYGWFPLTMGGPPNLPAIVSARGELSSFLDSCLKRYPIDPRRIVALGFSQGGVMAYSLALGAPERFSALVVISSWLPRELAELAGPGGREGHNLPALIQHGSRDELIAIDRARDSVEILRGLSVGVTYREYDIGHELSPRSLADLSEWLQEKILSPIVIAT